MELYTLEDADGIARDEEYDDYAEAQYQAQQRKLRVIVNEYEFTDSYMIDDFTEGDDESEDDSEDPA